MYLSTRGRYAIMAMIDLVELGLASPKPVTLAQIAERQRISLSYLEQLFAKLRKSGVVESVRGPGGGYRAKPAESITLATIVAAVDEDIEVSRCDGKTGCMEGGHRCNAHDLWAALESHITGFMHQVTLQMVIEKRFPIQSAFVGDVTLPQITSVRIEGLPDGSAPVL